MNAVCERLEPNLFFAEKMLKNSNIRHKYMRIRYEDFVLNPIGNTIKIYDFIGINMTMNVKEWLDEAMSPRNYGNVSVSSPQSMKRNVKSVLNSWRQELSYEAVEMIQNKCKGVLSILGYNKFRTNEDLKDLSKPYFFPDWH